MSKITKCPECGSDRITIFTTYDYIVGRNVKTNKIIYKDKQPWNGHPTIWSFRCRKCKWDSDAFTD